VIRVLVVGGVALFRGALAATLANEDDLDVVGVVDSGRDAGLTPVDVSVIDLDGATPTGAPAPALAGVVPNGPVVALTAEGSTLPWLPSGRIHGLVAKDGGVEQLVRAVRRVAAGERVVESASGAAADSPLTEREVEVLRLIAQGRSSAHIADHLGLTVGTVRNYVSAIIRKTGVRNRLEAMSVAAQSGWL
jgi:two-component system response regulator DesR